MSCGESSLAVELRRQEQLARKVTNLLLIRGAPLDGAKKRINESLREIREVIGSLVPICKPNGSW